MRCLRLHATLPFLDPKTRYLSDAGAEMMYKGAKLAEAGLDALDALPLHHATSGFSVSMGEPRELILFHKLPTAISWPV